MLPLDVTTTYHDDTEVELSVEDVAARLGLPASMVQRRIEAGLVPAQRVESVGGVRYRLRLADLGLDDGAPASAAEAQAAPPNASAPEPARGAVELQPVAEPGPATELMSMQLDPRELVAGLLDRWERTLEQRIHAEQRQRFEAELAQRQSTIRQLQLELEAVRAQQAAALGERDRLIEEQQRRITEASTAAFEAQVRAREAARRRGWFRR